MWNASRCPFVFNRPNNIKVVGFGVAVKAKMLTLGCLPLRRISSVIMSWTSVKSSSPAPRLFDTAAMSFPEVLLCASSMITANFLFLSPFTLSTIYGNFWMVVAIIFVLLFNAFARSADEHFSSITRINPALCSIPNKAAWSWRSTTTRSVTTTTLSNICLLSVSWSEVRRWANHVMLLVFPLPALCWIR